MARSEAFERNAGEVIDLVDAIPAGHCTSYGAIGSVLGITPRYVALIMATAPDVGSVPWHRVVGADGSVKAGGHRAEQIRRLQAEGFHFDNERIEHFAQRFVEPAARHRRGDA